MNNNTNHLKILFLFDFDDTLFHLDIDWEKIRQYAITSLRLNDNPKKYLFSSIYSTSNMNLKNLLLNRITTLEINSIKKGRPITGAKKFIKHCHQKNFKTAIISRNSHKTIFVALKQHKFPQVDLIVGREDVFHLKPHPEGIYKVLKYFNIPKSNSVYIGNSNFTDRQFAENAGIDFILMHTWSQLKYLID